MNIDFELHLCTISNPRPGLTPGTALRTVGSGTMLSAGNNLYTFIHNSVNHDYLLFSDVPEIVSVDDIIIKFIVYNTVSLSLEMYFRYLMMNHFIC